MPCNFRMACLLGALVALFCVTLSAAQTEQYDPAKYDCLPGWYYFDQVKSCYYFNNSQVSFDEASFFCQSFYAELLSVNNANEDQFVRDWLKTNDTSFLEWYTSGMKIANESAPNGWSLEWIGDGSPVPDDPKYWYSTRGKDAPGDVIIYRTEYGEKYGWWMAFKDRPRAFVCEISVDNVYRYHKNRRDFDYGEKPIEPIKVPRGPVLTRWPNRFSYYLEPLAANSDEIRERNRVENYVSMECLATGFPLPVYKWRYYRQSSGPYTEVTASDRTIMVGGKLIMFDVKSETDLGTYQCEASNKFGVVISPVTDLNLAVLDDFPADKPNPYTAARRSSLIVRCPSTTVKPEGSYNWYKETPLNFINNDYKTNVFVSQDGSLYFSSVQDADEGNYHCQIAVNLPNGPTVQVTSSEIAVEVNEGGSAEKPPKIFEKFPKAFPAAPKRGQNVRFECVAEGTGKLDYHWFRTEERRISDRARFEDRTNRTFFLFNVQEDDDGEYICEVKNMQDSKTQNSLTLKITSYPYFLIPLRDEHRDIGGPAEFRCKAGGSPPLSYRWFKDGAVFADSGQLTDPRFPPSRFELPSAEGNILRISDLHMEDAGMYQCEARNSYWSAMSTAQLRVLSFPPTFLKFPLPSRVLTTTQSTQGALIPCRPEGAPLPTVTWFHNGRQINPSTDQNARLRLLRDNTLLIRTPGAGDAGIYRCDAKNSLGTATNQSEVVVLLNTVIDVAPQAQTVEVGYDVTFQCKAWTAIELDLTYVWEHNGREIVFENETDKYRRGEGVDWGNLIILNPDFADEGTYTCIAKTVSDEKSRATELELLGPPGAPAALRGRTVLVAGTTNERMQLRWEKPPDHGKPIHTYTIDTAMAEINPDNWTHLLNFSSNQVSRDGDTIFVSLDSSLMKPYVRYRFRAWAFNDYGRSHVSRPTKQSLFLPAAPPPYAPRNVSGGGGKVGTLEITWETFPKQDWGNEHLAYDVRYRQVASSAADSAWYPNAKQSISEDGKQGRAVAFVGKDNYYLPYQVQVRAKNAFTPDGPWTVGPWSKIIVVHSAADIPLAYPPARTISVSSYNESAVVISWDPPIEDTRANVRGKLLGYRINYRLKDKEEANTLLDRRKTVLCPPAEVEPTCTVNEGMVIGLLPDIYYVFSVMTFNEAGNSLRSENVYGSPLRMAPVQPPTEVHIFTHGPNSVLVRWRGIITENREEPLLGYRVKYWRDGESMLDSRDPDASRDTEYVLRNLDPQPAVYNVRVYGYSRGGQGRMSSPDIRFMIDTYGRLIELQGYRPNSAVAIPSPTSLSSVIISLWTVVAMFF